MKYVVIHHSASAQTTTAEQVSSWHKIRNWGDENNPMYAPKSTLGWYGQYHFFIEGNGKITQFREMSEIGWHAGNWDVNKDSIAICFAGNFNNDELTSAQKKSLQIIWSRIQTDYPELSLKDFRLHRDFKSTECPGSNITFKLLEEILTDDRLPIHFILTLNDIQKEIALECINNVFSHIYKVTGLKLKATTEVRNDIIWRVTSGGVLTGMFNALTNKAFVDPYQIAEYGKPPLTCLLFDQEVVAPRNPATPVHHPLEYKKVSPFQVPINDNADTWYIESTIFHELLHALYYSINKFGIGLVDKTHSHAYKDTTKPYTNLIKEVLPYLHLIQNQMTNVKVLQNENGTDLFVCLPIRNESAMMSYSENFGLGAKVRQDGRVDWDSVEIHGTFKLNK